MPKGDFAPGVTGGGQTLPGLHLCLLLLLLGGLWPCSPAQAPSPCPHPWWWPPAHGQNPEDVTLWQGSSGEAISELFLLCPSVPPWTSSLSFESTELSSLSASLSLSPAPRWSQSHPKFCGGNPRAPFANRGDEGAVGSKPWVSRGMPPSPTSLVMRIQPSSSSSSSGEGLPPRTTFFWCRASHESPRRARPGAVEGHRHPESFPTAPVWSSRWRAGTI